MGYTFDGPNKLIILTSGTTSVDVKQVYSRWKEWVATDNNAKFLPAFAVIGGDPLPGGIYSGTTFFLENGWKFRPYEGDHSLSIAGNCFSRDGSPIVVKTLGNFNVLVTSMVSNLATAVATDGGGTATVDYDQIRDSVWNAPTSGLTTNGTIGKLVVSDDEKLTNINLKLGDIEIINTRILGLLHHNMSIDNTTYDQYGNLTHARVRLYDDAGNVGTDTGVIGEYQMICVAPEAGKFTLWKQVVTS